MYIVVAFPKNFSFRTDIVSFPIYSPSCIYRDKADAELSAAKLAKQHSNNEYVVFAAAKGFTQEDTPIVTKTYVMGY